MGRIGWLLVLAITVSSLGLAGCGGGIKEGSPPPDTGYVKPAEDPVNPPEKAK
jgi:hypothetical protein